MGSNAKVLGLFLLLLTAGAPLHAQGAAEPVALLVQAAGEVGVQRAGSAAPGRAGPGTALMVGDRVVIGGGGRAVILHRTGRMETAAAGTVAIPEPPAGQAAGLFAQTLRTMSQVATTDARTQPNRQGMIRPIAGAAVPISPRNSIRVLDVRPEFTWFAIPGAEAYVVQVKGPDGRIVRHTTTRDTVWSLPRGSAALVPGARYEWTVASHPQGRVAPVQWFEVATAEQFAAVAAATRQIIEAGLDPAGEGLFLLAVAYRDAGLHYEALAALERLERNGGGSGAPFHQLRGEILDALGEVEAALAAFEIADRAG
jgi:hypothetical protein